jgi:uncharacterized Zn finger protein
MSCSSWWRLISTALRWRPEQTSTEARVFYGYRDFPPYVPVAVRRRQAAEKTAALKKDGRQVSPVVIEGRKIVRTFWGQAWCDNLEAYSDYANRLPRGRTYVRNGSVIDLQISQGRLKALVSGSSIYEAEGTIQPLAPKRWRAIVRECAGRIDSVVELLAGKLSNGVMEVLCRKGGGLFPSPEEISLRCSCPDSAYLCKHLAAVLYGAGARLDHEPELLFVLRGIDKEELVSHAVEGGTLAGNEARPNALSGTDLSDLFGIDLEEGEPTRKTPAPAATRRTARPATARSRAQKPARDPASITAEELLARGVHRSTIQSWLSSGVLLRTVARGVYLKTRDTEARIARYLESLRP